MAHKYDKVWEKEHRIPNPASSTLRPEDVAAALKRLFVSEPDPGSSAPNTQRDTSMPSQPDTRRSEPTFSSPVDSEMVDGSTIMDDAGHRRGAREAEFLKSLHIISGHMSRFLAVLPPAPRIPSDLPRDEQLSRRNLLSQIETQLNLHRTYCGKLSGTLDKAIQTARSGVMEKMKELSLRIENWRKILPFAGPLVHDCSTHQISTPSTFLL